MAKIALFDTGKLQMSLATNQVNAKSNSSNQDFGEVLGKAKNKITTGEPKNTVVENYERKQEPQTREYKAPEEEKAVVKDIKDVKEVKEPKEAYKSSDTEKETDITKLEGDEETNNIYDMNELDDDVIKEIQETLAQIMMILEQRIGQDGSSFEEALQELNISVQDFLTKNPKELLLDIVQEEDISLITNEELLNTVTDVTKDIVNLLEDLETNTELTKQELDSLLNQFNASAKITTPNDMDAVNLEVFEDELIQPDLKIADDTLPIPDVEMGIMPELDKLQQTTKEEMSGELEVIKEQPKQRQTQVNTENADEIKLVNPEAEDVQAKNVSEDNTKEQSKNSKDSNEEKNAPREFVNETTVNKDTFENNLVTEKAEVFEYTDKTTQESILKQIQDNLKVIRQNDETTMEFQLHPQSLGNVKIALSTKGGTISAQISAQNETVKQALETQVTQLRTSLEEQGVKVEAIEISVQSHNLEKNLDEHGENKREQQEKEFDEKVIKTRRRNINLKAWAEGDEIVTEDELDDDTRLTAQMMEMYGNSMDLLA